MKYRILVVANSPPPLPGVPALAPSLRPISIARALRRAGHDVSLSFPASHGIRRDVVQKAAQEYDIPIEPVRMHKLGDFIAAGDFEFVITTNYHSYTFIIDDIEQNRFPSTEFIYDFFAPRVFEEASDPNAHAARIAEWTALKQRALRVSTAILVNGQKKIPYIRAWLLASKAALDKPLIVANFAIEPSAQISANQLQNRDFAQQPPRAFIAGNQQRWTASRLSNTRLLQALAENRWELVACGEPDITSMFANPALAERFASLKIESHPKLPFDSFCERQASCDVLIDSFTRSPERELAYVTRTAVALSSGVPAIHPRWTETGEIIAAFGAGWLYESEEEIPTIIEWITRHPHDLLTKRKAVEELRQLQMNETSSMAGLCSFLEMSRDAAKAPAIRRQTNRSQDPRTAFFLHNVFDPDWFAVRHRLPFIDADETPADYYERHASAHRSAPNFLLAHLQERLEVGDLRLMTVAELLSLMEGWLDIPWLRSKLSLDGEASPARVVEEYFRQAKAPDCSPNRFFSERFYRNYYPEFSASVKLGAFANAYDHYLSIGQEKGCIPSPFFIAAGPEPSPSSHGATSFAAVVTNTCNIAESPTPFFDLDFWLQSSQNGQGSTKLGTGLLNFIDNFAVAGSYGSAFHREVLTSKPSSYRLDVLKTSRQKAVEQIGSVPAPVLTDLLERLDARIEQIIRETTERLTRHSWALDLLTAYGEGDRTNAPTG